jgi:hypothetical protein
MPNVAELQALLDPVGVDRGLGRACRAQLRAGLALGDNQRFLCCASGAAAVEVRTGRVHMIVPDVGGADEVWFNPGDHNFYFGISAGPKLGVVDGNNDHVVAVLSGHGGLSVAAYAGNNQILDPEKTATGIAVFTSN